MLPSVQYGTEPKSVPHWYQFVIKLPKRLVRVLLLVPDIHFPIKFRPLKILVLCPSWISVITINVTISRNVEGCYKIMGIILKDRGILEENFIL